MHIRTTMSKSTSRQPLRPTAPSPARINCSSQGTVAVVDMHAEVDVRPDVLFSLLSDPNKHRELFSAIEGSTCRLVEDQGPRRRYEVDTVARWQFWRVGGTCHNKLYLDTDADAGTVSFQLREPGFLRVYEGTWHITPVGCSALNMHARSAAQQQRHQQAHQHQHHQQQSVWKAQQPAAVHPALQHHARSPGSSPVAAAGAALAAMTLASPQPLQQGIGFFSQVASRWLGSHSTPPSSATWPGPWQQHAHPAQRPHQPPSPMTTAAEQQAGGNASLPPQEEHEALPTRSVVRISNLRMAPKVAPPPPLGGLLRKHAVAQVQDMFQGLVAASLQAQQHLESAGAVHAALASVPLAQSLAATASSSPASSARSSLSLASGCSGVVGGSGKDSEPATGSRRHPSITSHCLHDIDACVGLPWWLDE